MASTQACHSTVTPSSVTQSIALQQRKPAVRVMAPSLFPSSSTGHALRAYLPQLPRRLAECRARVSISEEAGAGAPGATSQPSPSADAPAPWAATAVLSPLLLGLLQPLAAAAALDSLARDTSAAPSASAAVLAASESLAAAVAAHPAGGRLLYEVADMDAKTAATIALILRPVLSISTLLMIVRIVLTWYPQVKPVRLSPARPVDQSAADSAPKRDISLGWDLLSQPEPISATDLLKMCGSTAPSLPLPALPPVTTNWGEGLTIQQTGPHRQPSIFMPLIPVLSRRPIIRDPFLLWLGIGSDHHFEWSVRTDI